MQTLVSVSAEAKKQQNHSAQQPAQLLADQQSAFEDHSPQAAQLTSLQAMMSNSPPQQRMQAMQAKMNGSAQIQQMRTLQGRMAGGDVAQREEVEEPMQEQVDGGSVPREEVTTTSEASKPNNTGLPDNLKSGIESLSGMSMDHVKVHYNSSQPAQLNAHAYAQCSEIHVAPGQEQHVPHEAWHVVQQAQGRVKPTMQMKDGVPVNDDAGLEAEADVMGAKALGLGAVQMRTEGNVGMFELAPSSLGAKVKGATQTQLKAKVGMLNLSPTPVRTMVPPMQFATDEDLSPIDAHPATQLISFEEAAATSLSVPSSPSDQAVMQLILAPVPYDTRYDGPLLAHGGAVNRVRDVLNQRVDAAYQQALQWHTLAFNEDPLVRRWYEIARLYAQNPDQEPRIIHARFGYAIESIACQGLNNSQIDQLTVRTQVGHGHTRPDVVLNLGDQEIAWIDITSQGSVGHIRGKDGAGWLNRPFVYELVYPQLQLRQLLDATNDPYYEELGRLIADERQVEHEVKQANRGRLKQGFLDLRDRNGWVTGSHNAEEKREETRDFFIAEAANNAVEDERQSMIATRGALNDLGINDGPFGFNRGDVGSRNERINQVIDAASAEEIEIGQTQVAAGATMRIIGELRNSPIPDSLLEQLEQEFWANPGDRGTAMESMALKGAVVQFGLLDETIAHLHDEMNQADPRVPRLEARARLHRAGPANVRLVTVQAWRDEARAIYQQTERLTEAIDAANELSQYLVRHNIGFFQRPLQVQNWFGRLGEERPDPVYAREVQQWLYDRALEEAMHLVQNRDMPQLEAIHNYITAYWSPSDARVVQLENDVMQLMAGPQAQLDVVRAWQEQVLELKRRFADLNLVLQARRELDAYSNEHGLHIFNRPRQFGEWYMRLASDPPSAEYAQEIINWIAHSPHG